MKQPKGILGVMLRAYRAINGLTLRQLADATGISAPTLMRMERGRKFDAETWLKMQRFLLR